MKINNIDIDDDVLVLQLAEKLSDYKLPFMIVVDLGDHHLKVVTNVDKFESGNINMAQALEAIAHDFRKKEDKLINDIASSMANEEPPE